MRIDRISSNWVKQGIQYPPVGWFPVLLASAAPINVIQVHSLAKTVPFRCPKRGWTGNETISFTPDVVSSSQAFVTGFTRYPVQSDMVSDEHVVVSENERALLVFPKHVVKVTIEQRMLHFCQLVLWENLAPWLSQNIALPWGRMELGMRQTRRKDATWWPLCCNGEY